MPMDFTQSMKVVAKKMARKKPVSLIEVFKVMAKHDFNVKEASQELQINKSRIYNMKSKNKDKWEEMLKMLNRPDKKEEKEMIKQHGRETVARLSDKKFKPVPTVKSAMHEKHVGVTRRISDGVEPEVPKKEDKHPWKGMQPGDSSNMSKLYEENIKLGEQVKELKVANENIAGALNRANEEKESIGKEHNSLIDDFNYQKGIITDLQNRLEASTSSKAQPLEVEETVYAVKLGKVFVTPDLRLYGHHSAAQFKDIENAKQIKDEVGGTLYKSVLMPVEGDSDAKVI